MTLQSLLQTVSLVSGIPEQQMLNPFDAVIIYFCSLLHLQWKNKKVYLHLCQPDSTPSSGAPINLNTHTSTSTPNVKI